MGERDCELGVPLTGRDGGAVGRQEWSFVILHGFPHVLDGRTDMQGPA